MTKQELAAAWDKRDRLIEELAQNGRLPVRTLYIRRDDGGALAIGLLSERRGIQLIEWHGSSYQTSFLRQPLMQLEEYEQKAEGFGGVFGIGEKGACGWTLRLLENGVAVTEAHLLPGITSFADLMIREDRFLHGKKRPRQIPLWQLRPEIAGICEAVMTLWVRLVQEGG